MITVSTTDETLAKALTGSTDYGVAVAAVEAGLAAGDVGHAIAKTFDLGRVVGELGMKQAAAEVIDAMARSAAFAHKDATPQAVNIVFDPGAIQATIALPDAPLRVQVEEQPSTTRSRIVRDASGAIAGIETVEQ